LLAARVGRLGGLGIGRFLVFQLHFKVAHISSMDLD
jgi:hypothetical protein